MEKNRKGKKKERLIFYQKGKIMRDDPFSQLHSFLAEEEERLSTQIEDTNDDARKSGLNQVSCV